MGKVPVAAAQMTMPITVQVFNGTEIGGTVYSKSVKEYADTLLVDADAETVAMIKAMLNYGAKAQVYFDYNVDNLANKGCEIEESTTIPSIASNVTVDGAVSGITFYGASLVFESKIAVRYYFSASNDIDGYVFTANNVSYSAKEKDGLYYVEIPGINPQAMDEVIVLSVGNAENETMSVSYSPVYYISRMYNRASTSDALKNLLSAMYEYHITALAYVG